MAKIDKIERQAGFLSGESFEVVLSCNHRFKVDRQPSVKVGDDYKCPIC